MIQKINHVGIAVKSVDEAVKFFEDNFGAELINKVELEFMQQISALVQIGESQFELMEGMGEDSVISKYIEKKGEGIHHISLFVDNIDKACDELEEKGLRIINKIPAMKMAFVHPKSVFGILVELAEKQ